VPSHDLLVLWTQLAALLLGARLLGAAAGRLGQPAVVGELVAGLLLGPSVLGHAWPQGFRWLFPGRGSSGPLAAITAISLAVLLLSIGAETDLGLIRRLGRAATSVTSVSLVVPLVAGAALALGLPRSLRAAHGGTAPFVILVAGAVAVSSLPVIAKIVTDLGIVRRNVGQLAIAAGTVHDAFGFVLVALASSLAGGGSAGAVAAAHGGVAGVSLFVLTAGQKVVDFWLRHARRRGPDLGASLTVCAAAGLIAAAAMQAFGVEGALGAFVAGIALGRSRFQLGRAITVIDTTTATVFAPLYFATAGLRVDLGTLGKPAVALSFVALTAVALGSKFAGAAAGAALARLPRREVLALGVALNGRGALQVVIATAGLGLGVLTTGSYTVVILMSIVASLSVPPLLRASLAGWEGSAEERERLEREEELERNVIVRGDRLLLATRGSRSSIVAAEVLAAAWPEETPVTVVSVRDTAGGVSVGDGAAGAAVGEGAEGESAVRAIFGVLGEHRTEHRRLESQHVTDEILAEANLGYGVIGLGASDEPSGGHLLSPVLDDLLLRSPLPMVIVRRPRLPGGGLPEAFSTVLVPVSGTPSSRAGQEIACSIGRSLGTRVVLVHVVTRTDSRSRVLAMTGTGSGRAPSPRRRRLEQAEGAAEVVLRGAWEKAVEMGVEPEVIGLHGRSAGDEILSAAAEAGADVVALGTTVRQVEGRPFLGHTVEQVLARSDATVIVVALPEHSARLGAVMTEGGV
jgi:Kef-type K+ transport system membrane component KefB/nucleotide-binding universal stress UspA family protein